jgi:hypothetical protein
MPTFFYIIKKVAFYKPTFFYIIKKVEIWYLLNILENQITMARRRNAQQPANDPGTPGMHSGDTPRPGQRRTAPQPAHEPETPGMHSGHTPRPVQRQRIDSQMGQETPRGGPAPSFGVAWDQLQQQQQQQLQQMQWQCMQSQQQMQWQCMQSQQQMQQQMQQQFQMQQQQWQEQFRRQMQQWQMPDVILVQQPVQQSAGARRSLFGDAVEVLSSPRRR